MTNLHPTLEFFLSAERLLPYRGASQGGLDHAINLYEWNAQVSAAWWQDIGHLEVLVRNAMHVQLSSWSLARYGSAHWFDDPEGLLAPHRRQDILNARLRLERDNKPDEAGRIIAELSFGFWRYLVSSHYDRTLWRYALYLGFPGERKRNKIYGSLVRLHLLRNRIAHHEPIHRIPLIRRHEELLTVVQWIDPELRTWVERQSRVRRTLKLRPQISTFSCRL